MRVLRPFIRRLRNPRTAVGVAAILVGCAIFAVTLIVVSPPLARAQSTGAVFLAISSLTDNDAGQLPAGSTVTLTANITNSVANTEIGDATPTLRVSYSAGEVSALGNGAGWTCSTTTNSGELECSDGTLGAGSATSLPISFSVTGNPGDPASFTATVSDAAADINSASFSGNDTATDSAGIVNATGYTKDVAVGAFPRELGTDQLVSGTGGTYTFSDSTARVSVRVPSGALPDGTHLSVYAANSSYWSAQLNRRKDKPAFVDGYAVAFTPSGASTGTTAATPITLVASDPRITPKGGEILYRATTTGLASETGTVAKGTWSVAFTADPGFVLVAKSGKTLSAVPLTLFPDSTTQPPATVATPLGRLLPLVLASITLIVLGAASIGLRRGTNAQPAA